VLELERAVVVALEKVIGCVAGEVECRPRACLPAAGAFRSSCGRRNVEAGRVLILDETFGLGVT
jgi:hypothetical protein